MDALRWGVSQPLIKVENLIGRKSRALAQYDPRFKWIELNAWICEVFERNSNDPSARQSLEATLLHEMVHFGNHHSSTKRPHPPGTNTEHYMNDLEYGLNFEVEAYGRPGFWMKFGPMKETRVRM